MKVVMHLIFHEHKQTVKSRLINFQIKQSYKITALALTIDTFTFIRIKFKKLDKLSPIQRTQIQGSGADTKITIL